MEVTDTKRNIYRIIAKGPFVSLEETERRLAHMGFSEIKLEMGLSRDNALEELPETIPGLATATKSLFTSDDMICSDPKMRRLLPSLADACTTDNARQLVQNIYDAVIASEDAFTAENMATYFLNIGAQLASRKDEEETI